MYNECKWGNAMIAANESPIFHIMREEHQRLVQAEQDYLKAIDELPRGAPRIRRIRNGDYLYLHRREGDKFVDQYIGNAESDKSKDVLEKVAYRRELVDLLKRVRRYLKDVKKVLRGKL